jgi:hypothetical protein
MSRLGVRQDFHGVLYTNRTFRDLLRVTTLEVIEARRYGFLWRRRLSRLPGILSNWPPGVALINGLDAILERLFFPFCQNWSFVLIKGRASAGRSGCAGPSPTSGEGFAHS